MIGEKSDFTCICKVTDCPGPRLFFEKVNFNGRNQIGPARLDNSDRIPSWLGDSQLSSFYQ